MKEKLLLAHLASDSVRTELSESERRRDLPEQGDDVDVLDPALGVGVVLGPEADELVQVVRAKDGPIPEERNQFSLKHPYVLPNCLYFHLVR